MHHAHAYPCAMQNPHACALTCSFTCTPVQVQVYVRKMCIPGVPAVLQSVGRRGEGGREAQVKGVINAANGNEEGGPVVLQSPCPATGSAVQ